MKLEIEMTAMTSPFCVPSVNSRRSSASMHRMSESERWLDGFSRHWRGC